ncbi:MAG: 3'(2'),5'-bisphosphate nucleotidase CysQ [Roseovarius sp.]|nr:3'(2'),5'-bisphosphate nucleotidase CysQ [Roseovarius sp.]MCY4208326.1 3'(2'),5'-bisphosphate nucleotidase CysQ [Roseovarius sp.]
MPATDLPLLVEVALDAGKLAVGLANSSFDVWSKPDGEGPVTSVDLAVNELLKTRLLNARRDYGWLSEESKDCRGRRNAKCVFVIDPIDGTRSFIDGSGTWAHSIAVAEQGLITAAVVYLPMLDKLYSAAKGRGATLNGKPVRVGKRTSLAGANVLAAKSGLAPERWKEGVPDVNRAFRPSLAYRLCLVAEGCFDATFTLGKTWEWDIAAGDLILREAGAATSDRHGNPLVFNTSARRLEGMLAANPALHEELRGGLNSR